MRKGHSWAQYPKLKQQNFNLWWQDDSFPKDKILLPYGNGLSYGDSCQIEHGVLLNTQKLNRFIQFDQQAGYITCEAGVTLAQILNLIVPKGWFLPVLPGTQFVTVGGAIANDIHGKNHVTHGSFGDYVISLYLRRSDNTTLICTPTENADYLKATIGGIGLTGLITQATIKLIPIIGNTMVQQQFSFSHFVECFELFKKTDSEYKVAWLNLLYNSQQFGSGIFSTANHCATHLNFKSRRLVVPFNLPNWALNATSMKLFNFFHYNKQLQAPTHVHYSHFFFPLDHILHWNRIYGKSGFLQYQCCLPRQGCEKIINCIKAHQIPIFLTTLKYFGDKAPSGLLSFPAKGYTLALDIPMQGKKTLEHCLLFDKIVSTYGGKIYPAKDARMPSQLFKQMYPCWSEFQDFIDPCFNSSFWQRIKGGTSA